MHETAGAIRIQPTPNPNARKFILPATQFDGSTNYASVQEAAVDACVRDLFKLDGVYNVLTAQNFVTVNKRAEFPWEPLEAAVCAVLAQHYL